MTVFIDSTVPMYLVGAPHPNKVRAQRAVQQLIAEEVRLVASAEVLQEILHRYGAIGRPEAIQPAFEVLLGITDAVLSIELGDVQRAKEIVLATPGLSARDALHAAVMQHHGIEKILSFDRGFEQLPGVARLLGGG